MPPKKAAKKTEELRTRQFFQMTRDISEGRRRSFSNYSEIMLRDASSRDAEEDTIKLDYDEEDSDQYGEGSWEDYTRLAQVARTCNSDGRLPCLSSLSPITGCFEEAGGGYVTRRHSE